MNILFNRLVARDEAKQMIEAQEPTVLTLTEREVKEIKHAIFYANECGHGTTGHNQLVLIAKLTKHLGFLLLVIDQEQGKDVPWTGVELPNGVEVKG